MGCGKPVEAKNRIFVSLIQSTKRGRGISVTSFNGDLPRFALNKREDLP